MKFEGPIGHLCNFVMCNTIISVLRWNMGLSNGLRDEKERGDADRPKLGRKSVGERANRKRNGNGYEVSISTSQKEILLWLKSFGKRTTTVSCVNAAMDRLERRSFAKIAGRFPNTNYSPNI